MKNGPFVVAISGDPVSGKSTAIKELMRRFESVGVEVTKVAAGQLFREMAEAANLKVHELTALAKDYKNTIDTLKSLPGANEEFFNSFKMDTSKSIDKFIDGYMLYNVRKAIKKYQNCKTAIVVVDSRIVGLLMKRAGEKVYNVRFSVIPEIAAKRLMMDSQNRGSEVSEQIDFETALKSVKQRATEDRKRFIQLYSNNINDRNENAKVDLKNRLNYDLVIDTSGVSITNVVDVLQNGIDRVRKETPLSRGLYKEWRSAKYICVPNYIADIPWHLATELVKVLKVNGEYYALSALDYVGFIKREGAKIEEEKGTEEGYKLVPIDVVAENDEMFIYQDVYGDIVGVTAREFVKNMFR